MTTKPASENDYTFLAGVFLRAMRPSIEACRGYWDEAKERAQFLDQLRLSETQIVDNDGENIGFLMASEAGVNIQLHTLCIVPEHQGRGFGTAILRKLIHDARSRQRGVELWVLKTNSGARSLYERLGFVITEETTNHYRMRLSYKEAANDSALG